MICQVDYRSVCLVNQLVPLNLASSGPGLLIIYNICIILLHDAALNYETPQNVSGGRPRIDPILRLSYILFRTELRRVHTQVH